MLPRSNSVLFNDFKKKIQLILGRGTLKTTLQQFCGIHFKMPVGSQNVISGSKKVV